ncbi:MAG: heme-binding protein [Rhodoferax sp.]|nr:heme-binding protein [Rhodoferax sp.]
MQTDTATPLTIPAHHVEPDKHHPSPLRRVQQRKAGIWLVLTYLLLWIIPMSTHATEEPAYKVVRTLQETEIREYAAYTVAEVIVPGPAESAGNRAFPILAGYIFGKNKGERKLEMTAPVTQAATPTKLEMTAPVTQSAAKEGYRIQFVLPKGVSKATAPEPLDERVSLRDIPAHTVAVIRYSGFWSEANYREHLGKLQNTLGTAGMVWQGEPVFSRYNQPMTPWFMRRNEIWLNMDKLP